MPNPDTPLETRIDSVYSQWMTVGELLRRARRKRKKTQKDIAAAVGVAQPTVHAWEHDQCLPGAERIRDVAEAYGISPVDLLPKTPTAKRRRKAA